MRAHPERIDQYELQVCLARGGLEVWKAFDTQARRTVAVKLLRGKLQTAPDVGAVIFLRTLRVLASLRHPNIVPCYDFSISHLPGAASATPYWVTEYIGSETLADYHRTTSRQERFLSVHEIVRLASAIGLSQKIGTRGMRCSIMSWPRCISITSVRSTANAGMTTTPPRSIVRLMTPASMSSAASSWGWRR